MTAPRPGVPPRLRVERGPKVLVWKVIQTDQPRRDIFSIGCKIEVARTVPELLASVRAASLPYLRIHVVRVTQHAAEEVTSLGAWSAPGHGVWDGIER
jgi:hypothetical protein